MLDAFMSDYALVFSIPALTGTFFFVLRLLLMLAGAGMGDEFGAEGFDDVGLDADGVGDLGDGGHHHHSAGDSTDSFKVLSLQAIAGFVMGFGWGGLGAYRGLDWSPTLSVLAATGGGVLMVWVLRQLFRSIALVHASGNISISSALGCTGSVYTRIPASGSGRGKVRIVVKDRSRLYNAVSAGEGLARHARIRVVKVNRDNTLVVEPERG